MPHTLTTIAELEALCGTPIEAAAHHVDPKSLPSAGQIFAALSANRIGGDCYDREWPARAAKTM